MTNCMTSDYRPSETLKIIRYCWFAYWTCTQSVSRVFLDCAGQRWQCVCCCDWCQRFPPWPAPGVVVEQLSLAPVILHVHQANSNITFPCWALHWKKGRRFSYECVMYVVISRYISFEHTLWYWSEHYIKCTFLVILYVVYLIILWLTVITLLNQLFRIMISISVYMLYNLVSYCVNCYHLV